MHTVILKFHLFIVQISLYNVLYIIKIQQPAARAARSEATFSCFTASGPFSRKHIITKSI